MDETLPRLRPALEAIRRALPWLSAAGAVLGTLWAMSGSWHWSGEAAADYRWHLGWACVALGGLASAFRSWIPTGALMTLALVNLWPELRLSVPQQEVLAAGPQLTVGIATLSPDDSEQVAFLEWMGVDLEEAVDHRPDLLLIAELDGTALASLDTLATRGWTERWTSPPREGWADDTHGWALVSRRAILDPVVDAGGDLVRFGLADSDLTFLAARAPRPLSAAAVERRSEITARAAELAAESPDTVLMIQLGATGYSPAFRSLTERGGLTDTRLGFGRKTSWSDDRYLPGLELAVDHVLVGDGIAVIDRDVEDIFLGYGHQPVVARIVDR